MALVRRPTDILVASIQSVTYKGPAATLHLWAEVRQANIARWWPSGVMAVSMPRRENLGVVQLTGAVFNMNPQSGVNAPVVGLADGVAAIGTTPDVFPSQLFALTVPSAYDIQLAVVTTPPRGLEYRVTGFNAAGSPVVDFLWIPAQKDSQQIVDAEYLDISTVGPGFGDGTYLSLKTDTLAMDVDPITGKRRAAGLVLTPGVDHWWRVSSFVNGVWQVSAPVGFIPGVELSPAAPAQEVTNLVVTFS